MVISNEKNSLLFVEYKYFHIIWSILQTFIMYSWYQFITT
jgi:hypothetical protein